MKTYGKHFHQRLVDGPFCPAGGFVFVVSLLTAGQLHRLDAGQDEGLLQLSLFVARLAEGETGVEEGQIGPGHGRRVAGAFAEDGADQPLHLRHPDDKVVVRFTLDGRPGVQQRVPKAGLDLELKEAAAVHRAGRPFVGEAEPRQFAVRAERKRLARAAGQPLVADRGAPIDGEESVAQGLLARQAGGEVEGQQELPAVSGHGHDRAGQGEDGPLESRDGEDSEEPPGGGHGQPRVTDGQGQRLLAGRQRCGPLAVPVRRGKVDADQFAGRRVVLSRAGEGQGLDRQGGHGVAQRVGYVEPVVDGRVVEFHFDGTFAAGAGRFVAKAPDDAHAVPDHVTVDEVGRAGPGLERILPLARRIVEPPRRSARQRAGRPAARFGHDVVQQRVRVFEK